MALKGRGDDRMRKEFFKFYFFTITSGLLYLAHFVTSEPVCYSRIYLDERNIHIKRVDCNGSDKICMRFASRKEVNSFDIFKAPCNDLYDYPSPSGGSSQEKDCQVITCRKDHLPIAKAGFFNCSGYTVGEKCNLTCDDGYYPSSLKETTCEENVDFEGNWSVGTFQCSECNEWNEWNGSEYKFISTEQTWQESRQLCESDNSNLITIENEEENDFVYKVLWHCADHSTWIGLNDLDKEGTWEWSDGTVSTYRNWGKGKPDGGEADNCVRVQQSNGKWNDLPCTSQRYAVCARNKSLK